MSDDDHNDELDSGDDSHLITQQLKGKKRAREEETLEDTRPCARRRCDSKDQDTKLPLPDPFDGNPKNLKKFLDSLGLCFLGAPYKYGRDESKLVMAGLTCT